MCLHHKILSPFRPALPGAALCVALILFGPLLATTPRADAAHRHPQRQQPPAVKTASTQTPALASASASAPSTMATASLAQSDTHLAQLEVLLAGCVNDARRALHLPALAFDPELAGVARAHSAEMRDKKYFAHRSPTPSLAEPLDRYRAVFGTTPAIVAENIFRSWGSPRQVGEAAIDEAHKSLMNSPGHRANILQPDVRRIGIGLSVNDNGDLWVTEMFSKVQQG
jgi:uncharacterized protein YkwD